MHYLEIQGLFKDYCHNSRTFQGLPSQFKDFSRTSEHFGETHELHKVGLYDGQKGPRGINEIYQRGSHKRLGRNGLST